MDPVDRRAFVGKMVDVLVSHIGQKEPDGLARELLVTPPLPSSPLPDVIAFSGGVSEYVFERETEVHGDLGKALAHHLHHALTDKRIPYPVYDPGQGIRATVVGASQFSVQVSGNTIMISDHEALPLRNVPVVNMRLALDDDIDPARVAGEIANALTRNDIEDGAGDVAVAFRWQGLPLHARLHRLADGIRQGLGNTIAAGRPVILMMDGDAGKTLGGILRNEFDIANEIISIDGVHLKDLDYVDIGEIIQPTEVVPLVIKSLLFSSPDMAAADGAAAHLAG